MDKTVEVGKKLVELCRAGKNQEAVEKLYSPSIVSIEPMSSKDMPGRIEGIAAVRKHGEWWEENHEVHSQEAAGPWPHGNRFIVHFKYDVTGKGGPMKGKRIKMDETALYTVKDGKITQAEFFYHMDK
jgi:ketosteroid isomerase-like protein